MNPDLYFGYKISSMGFLMLLEIFAVGKSLILTTGTAYWVNLVQQELGAE